MSKVVRQWRDRWCEWHGHLESDFECDYMRFPFDYPEEKEDGINFVMVTVEREAD